MPKKKGELSIEERLEQSIVAKEEEPYKLPSNWVWTKVKEVNEVVTGNTPSKQKIEYWENKNINFVKPSDLNQGRNLTVSEEYVDNRAKEKIRLIPKFSTILCCIGSIGKSSFSEIECCTNQQINSLIPKKTLNPIYNYYYLNSSFFINQMKNSSSATTIAILNKSKTEELLFPLPPLEEQKRIVEKLDSLFEKIQKIKEIIEEVKEKTTSRREAILSKAFSGELTEKWRGENKNFIPVDEILLRVENEKQELIKNKIIKKSSKIEPITENDILFDIPQSWKRIKLNDIAFVTKLAGFEYTKNIFPNLVEKGIPLFKGKNVQDGKIVYEFESYIPESISDELPRSQITKKCLLTPYVGTIGNIALFEGNFKAHLGSNVGKIEVFNNFNENILEKYLLYYFRSCYGLAQLKKHRKATAQESISIEAIRDCVIILPPLEEQKEIVRVLDKIFEEENRISELISLENKIEILEKTILDRAFRGELGTGNNDDEPAIELLKKCLEER